MTLLNSIDGLSNLYYCTSHKLMKFILWSNKYGTTHFFRVIYGQFITRPSPNFKTYIHSFFCQTFVFLCIPFKQSNITKNASISLQLHHLPFMNQQINLHMLDNKIHYKTKNINKLHSLHSKSKYGI